MASSSQIKYTSFVRPWAEGGLCEITGGGPIDGPPVLGPNAYMWEGIAVGAELPTFKSFNHDQHSTEPSDKNSLCQHYFTKFVNQNQPRDHLAIQQSGLSNDIKNPRKCQQ